MPVHFTSLSAVHTSELVSAWDVEGSDSRHWASDVLGAAEVLGLRKYSLPSIRTMSLAMVIALK